jgi:colanic acid biosynthesis glycosyl transferase WcaI
MKVRFFSTFEPATSFYRDLLPSLAAAGDDVEVVMSRAEYRGGRPLLATALAGTGVRVHRVRSGVAQPASSRQKVQAMITYLVGAVTRSAFGARADVNVFFSTPPFFAGWGFVLRALRGQPYLCIIQDVWPDVLIADGRLPAGGRAARTLTWLSRLIWRRADAVVVIGRCMAELVTAGGVDPARVHMIPNWAHSSVTDAVAVADNEIRRELGIEDRFVVLYSGNLGVSHSFDEILAVAAQFHETHPDVVFLFIGGGSRRGQVAGEKEGGLDNVRLLPFQPAERLGQTLSAGDVQFISLRAGFEGIVVPSKAYGAMAAGRPLLYLGHASGEIAREIAEGDLGTVVAPGDVAGLTAALERYLAEPDLVARQGANARRASEGLLGADNALTAWRKVLRALATPED